MPYNEYACCSHEFEKVLVTRAGSAYKNELSQKKF